ncbi:MAG: helix-turn-helix domain-containing protein [Rhizobiaceae bacterium]
MEIREVFAANLKRCRKAKGLSQEDLARHADLDLDRTYVSALERCLYAASIDVVARIAEVLEVRPSDMLDEHEG